MNCGVECGTGQIWPFGAEMKNIVLSLCLIPLAIGCAARPDLASMYGQQVDLHIYKETKSESSCNVFIELLNHESHDIDPHIRAVALDSINNRLDYMSLSYDRIQPGQWGKKEFSVNEASCNEITFLEFEEAWDTASDRWLYDRTRAGHIRNTIHEF